MLNNIKKTTGFVPLLIAAVLFVISANAVSNVGSEPHFSDSAAYIINTENKNKAYKNERAVCVENQPSEAEAGSESPEYSKLLMDYTAEIPILFYQHMHETSVASTIVSPAIFEEHLQTLIDNGYTSVTFDDIINYVEGDGELPEKPVIITFDDGYLSSYEYAFPLLKKYNMKATMFIIGLSVGRNTYRDTDSEEYAIIGRFSYEQAREMIDSGLITIQSHSYDMHQWNLFEEKLGNEYRDGAMPLPGESEEEYRANFIEDYELAKQGIEGELNTGMVVYAYPHSKYTPVTEQILKEMGIKVTVTLDHGSNDIIKGQPETLYNLSRMAVTAVSGGEFLKMLDINRVVVKYDERADEVLPRNLRWMLK